MARCVTIVDDDYKSVMVPDVAFAGSGLPPRTCFRGSVLYDSGYWSIAIGAVALSLIRVMLHSISAAAARRADCGGGKSGKVRTVRRPKRDSATGSGAKHSVGSARR